MQEDESNDPVARLVHAVEMQDGVERGCERSIEPSATLANELSNAIRNVGLTLGCFDIREVPGRCEKVVCRTNSMYLPSLSSLSHQLEAQDSVFCQKHVLLEDVHSVDAFLAKYLRQCMIAMKVLFKGATHDCPEAIRREGARKNAYIAERALKGLIQHVRDLIFEILYCDERVQQRLSTLQHSMDLSASSTQMFIVIECFPKS